jgi:hypothetical protein
MHERDLRGYILLLKNYAFVDPAVREASLAVNRQAIETKQIHNHLVS